MSQIQIIGRSSSHFTRVTRIFAHELGVAYQLVPIYNMRELEQDSYEGNPALKLPSLRRGESLLFGTENICRALAELAEEAGSGRRIVWPEALRTDLLRNAQELVWHAMAAQVQLVVGTMIAKLPADNLYFTKAWAGFEGALRWLDAHLAQLLAALDALPEPRDLSLLEVTLFCLIEHLTFRPSVPIEGHAALRRFAEEFATRPSAQATAYAIDHRPKTEA
jgi:glutathione S-transferase